MRPRLEDVPPPLRPGVHAQAARAPPAVNRARRSSSRLSDDVSFVVEQGEFFGVIGRNGSGKSTLLKCLAGIYVPNGGSVRVSGRISPFIELGVGFNPELTALDNVVLNASLLGIPPSEARGTL